MANLRDLRQRITSVGNIQKITAAMEMVATTKLRRFQGRAVAAKPYAGGIEELVRRLSGAIAADPALAGDSAALFQSANPDAPVGLLFIGSDRGLCGAYNSNVQRALDAEVAKVRAGGGEVLLFVFGRKAARHATRMKYPLAAWYEDRPLEKVGFADAAAVTADLVHAQRTGEVSSVRLCFTRFLSMARYVPNVDDFLPIAPPAAGGQSEDVILEPDAREVLGRLIPRYLETAVFHALLESITSEYASRRFAMKNATDAASDMKHEITRSYNKARQQKITSEILEIVAGAEAL
ncbi:MAG TPA: ATP synthase F1 subunit gamma [Planctomycetota bacterium]